MNWARETTKSCYICGQFETTYKRFSDMYGGLWREYNVEKKI